MKRSSLLLTTAFFLLTAVAPSFAADVRRPVAATGDPTDIAAPTTARVLPGMVHVKLTAESAAKMHSPVTKNGVIEIGVAEIDALHRELGVTGFTGRPHEIKNKALDAQLGLSRWYVADFPKELDAEAVRQQFEALAAVEVVTPVVEAVFHLVPNDPQYANNWGHNNTGQLPGYDWGGTWDHTGPGVGTPGFDSNTQEAWDSPQVFGSAAVRIAIIDSGVDIHHTDYNYVGGWDYISGDSNPDEATNAHGTACAGVAAATTNNGSGVAGVAGGCGIFGYRTSNNVHISNALIAAADASVEVISMSLGFPGFTSLTDVDDACTYAWGADAIIFSSTGNDNQGQLWVPAIHPNVTAIGAASPCGERKRSSSVAAELNPGVFADPNGWTCDGERWWGSNWGVNTQDAAGAVDFIAPTILPTTDILGVGGYTTGAYEPFFNGTSCSCPFAAGVAALIRSANPGFTNQQTLQRMRDTARDVTSVESGVGWDQRTGYGIVDAQAAVGLPDGLPWAPAGWSDLLVVTDVNTSTFNDALFPAVLPGDQTAYFNWQYANLGTANFTNPNLRGYLDEVLIYNATGGDWVPNWRFGNLNWARFVRGGRHTIRSHADPLELITELDETNNAYTRQLAWTGVDLVPNTLIVRSAPPKGNSDWSYLSASGHATEFANDGMGFPRRAAGQGYWRAVAVHSASNVFDQDYDVGLMNPTSDVFTGHDNASFTGTQSLKTGGLLDFVLVNDNTVGQGHEVTFWNQSGTGTANNYIESRQSALPEYTAPNGATETVSLASHEMLVVREVYSGDASVFRVSVEVDGATDPVTLKVYDYTFAHGRDTNAMATSVTDPGGYAFVDITPVANEFYGITVHRDPVNGTAPMQMTIRVRPPVNLAAQQPVPGEKSVYCIPDRTGRPLTQAWQWNGVIGDDAILADGHLTAVLTNANNGNPLVGIPAEDIYLRGGTMVACPGGAAPDFATDANGYTEWRQPIGVGGQIYSGWSTFTQVAMDHTPALSVSYLPSSAINFNSADINGDKLVNLTDVGEFSVDFNGSYSYRSDFVWDGILDLRDVGELALGLGAGCVAPAKPVAAKPDATIADRMGLYFDREGTRQVTALSPGQTAVAYLLLDGPAAQQGIRGWELRLEGSDNVVIGDWTLPDGSIDLGRDGDHVVGTGKVAVAEGDRPLLLATVRLQVTNQAPAQLYLRPADLRSAGVEAPSIALAGEETLLRAARVEGADVGAPAVEINGDGTSRDGTAFAFRGFNLSNVPNPFNPATEIRFDLPRRGEAEVRIYDVSGRAVRRLGGEVLEAGSHGLRWNGTDARNAPVVSGIYFYRLYLDGEAMGSSERMTLLK